MSSDQQKASFAEEAARYAQHVDSMRNSEAHKRLLESVRRDLGGVGQAQGAIIGQKADTIPYHDPQKRFTRAEVLAVLRAQVAALATRDATPESRVVAGLIAIFERME